MDKELIFSYRKLFVITDGVKELRMSALTGQSISSKLGFLVKCLKSDAFGRKTSCYVKAMLSGKADWHD